MSARRVLDLSTPLLSRAQFIEADATKKLPLIGADKMSSITDLHGRNTCILFGDAAAAVILEPTTEEGVGIIDHRLYRMAAVRTI